MFISRILFISTLFTRVVTFALFFPSLLILITNDSDVLIVYHCRRAQPDYHDIFLEQFLLPSFHLLHYHRLQNIPSLTSSFISYFDPRVISFSTSTPRCGSDQSRDVPRGPSASHKNNLWPVSDLIRTGDPITRGRDEEISLLELVYRPKNSGNAPYDTAL